MQYSCITCDKFFISKLALSGHKRIHGDSKGKISKPICCCIITKREIEVASLHKFQARIKFCQYCAVPLNSYRKFCNQSCAAKFNNVDRVKRGYSVTAFHKQQISITLSKRSKITGDQKISGDYCKLYQCTCFQCNTKVLVRQKSKYCSGCAPLYSSDARARFKFVFNVYKYPDLFDIKMIQEIGWYSRGGTAGKWNPNGLSRDHRISVSDAIKYNYDPFYIKHPLNCEIMSWADNNKKKCNSSIKYEELKNLINSYESNKKK